MHTIDWKIRKKLFDLQMFAEDGDGSGADGNGADGAGDSATGAKEQKPAAKYTDDDVDRIVARTIAKERQRAEKQAAEERAKATEAERLAKMTAEEKNNERMNAMQKQLDEYIRKDAVAAMTKEARSMLSDKNIHVGDALLAKMVGENAEDTKASVEEFISLFTAAVEKAVKEKVKGDTPKTGTSTGLTKEQILAIPNRVERQKMMKEHKDLF